MSAATPAERGQWEEAARWMARADEDMRAAEALTAAAEPMIGPAAFHCQQAAEKMAKAVLVAHGEPPPRVHDIVALGRRVAALHPGIGEEMEALGGVTSWYAAARYPDASADAGPSLADLREVLSRLDGVRRLIEEIAPG